MKEVKKIMVPVDFTSHTQKIVEYACDMAKAFSAELLFFHVVESFRGFEMMLVHPSFEEMARDMQVKADERMNNLVEDYSSAGQKCTGSVVRGDIVEEILKYAEDNDVDLMIIGTHGVRGLEKVLMGSVAERVVRAAPCPALVFNPLR